jgi:hypothetical protein
MRAKPAVLKRRAAFRGKYEGRPWLTLGSRGHLEIILEVCHARGIPLLTAICVNQAELSTGELGGDALKGFISGAKRIGHTITDEKEFLRDCQRECFE